MKHSTEDTCFQALYMIRVLSSNILKVSAVSTYMSSMIIYHFCGKCDMSNNISNKWRGAHGCYRWPRLQFLHTKD